jgi:hypothetical protein
MGDPLLHDAGKKEGRRHAVWIHAVRREPERPSGACLPARWLFEEAGKRRSGLNQIRGSRAEFPQQTCGIFFCAKMREKSGKIA